MGEAAPVVVAVVVVAREVHLLLRLPPLPDGLLMLVVAPLVALAIPHRHPAMVWHALPSQRLLAHLQADPPAAATAAISLDPPGTAQATLLAMAQPEEAIMAAALEALVFHSCTGRYSGVQATELTMGPTGTRTIQTDRVVV